MTDANRPVLEIVRILPAPPADVFAAWTDPASLAVWMRPSTVHLSEATLDLRVGGRFRIVMHNPAPSRPVVHEGEYLVIEPPTRLVFTWSSVNTNDQPTRVTVALAPYGRDATRLTLTHEALPDADAFGKHERGWETIVTKLAERLAPKEDR